jgi:phenol 2-monooxygenase
MTISQTDVLIVGAGPVGLLTGTNLLKSPDGLAYSLARFGIKNVHIIERYPKSTQAAFGRAITFWPRSIELLDQLGLFTTLMQTAFVCRRSVTFDGKGRRVDGRGWSFLQDIKDTYMDFAMVIRQKYTEAHLRDELAKLGVSVDVPAELISYTIDNSQEFPIQASVRSDLVTKTVQCKYLIGADGARSTVRDLAKIELDKTSSVDKWVRIDGILTTDVPADVARSYIAFESPTHGNVLWAPLDHGTTRIGYAYTPEREAMYPPGDFTEEIAVKEAIEACKPFKVQFDRVDWHTIYAIRQCVAKTLSANNGRVLLAGDSAHQHSSAAAQGQNQGLHDAVNLSWKLALVLKGLASSSLLDTYTEERLPVAKELIRYDRDVAALMSCKVPAKYDATKDVNELLGEIFDTAKGFNTGLGIEYPANGSLTGSESALCGIRSGQRALDIKVMHPGSGDIVRLLHLMPNFGAFHVVIFAGSPSDVSNASIARLNDYLATSPLTARPDLFSFLTISAYSPPRTYNIYETLNGEGIGRTYFDLDGNGHDQYGISKETTDAVVLLIRPDGWVGWVGNTSIVINGALESFLRQFLAL